MDRIIYRSISILTSILLIFLNVEMDDIYSYNTMSIQASAAAFSRRTSAPTKDNKYYYQNNVFYKSGYGLPNCTCYAYGRAYELLGTLPDLCTGNAGTWFNANKKKYDSGNGGYPYSSDVTKPALGAIVVWSKTGGAGHVAVVEAINGTNVITSESGWKSALWWDKTRSTTNSNLSAGSKYHFLG